MQADSVDFEDIKDYLNINEDRLDTEGPSPGLGKPSKDPKKLR